MLALDRDLLEIFTEKVLRTRAAPMPRIASDRHDQVAISLVIGEDALEAITQVEEVSGV